MQNFGTGKYLLLNRDNLTIPIQMQLSQQQKTISQFSSKFLNPTLNFKYFEKKDDSRRFCISEITDSENVVRSLYKKCRLRQPFNKQYDKRALALLIPASKHLYLIHWSLLSQLSWKKSLLLTSKILVLLVNTLAADEKYPVLNRDNLTIPIQMQLSNQQKLFLNFLLHFWNLAEILNILKKKHDPHRFCLFEITKKCLKSPVSEDPSTSNMIFIVAPLSYLLIATKESEFKKVTFINMLNLGTTS